MKRVFLVSVFCLLMTALAQAGERPAAKHRSSAQVPARGSSTERRLTDEEIARVQENRRLIEEIDTKTLQETIADIEKTQYPQVNLQIFEAMAKTYAEIVREQKVSTLQDRQWLYSMVKLNMAYLQFGANQDNDANNGDLNRLIRWKLKGFLPAELFKQKGFFVSTE